MQHSLHSAKSLTLLRRIAGRAIGETAHAILLAAGVIVFVIFALNGFAPMRTARFVDNFTGRLLTSEAEATAGFGVGLGVLFTALVCVIVFVRYIDRRRLGGKAQS